MNRRAATGWALACACFLAGGEAAAQRVVRDWHDPPANTQLKARYVVDEANPTLLHGPYEAFFPDGTRRVRGRYVDGAATGRWTYYFPNGNPKSDGYLRDGEPDGLWAYFYEDSTLRRTGVLRGQQPDSTWRYFYPDGRLRREGNYRDGEQVGLWKAYFDTGDLKSTSIYTDDTTYYERYHTTGQLRSRGTLVEGRSAGHWEYFRDDGTLKAAGHEADGQREGTWTFYHRNGNASARGHYADGVATGVWQEYYPNGDLKATGERQEGLQHGTWQLFYPDGTRRGTATFERGNGPYREYHPNGKLRAEGQWRNGRPDGFWRYYTPDGTLEGEAAYQEGVGTYTGYYADGTRRLRGRVEDEQRVGTWEMYNPDGTLSGYYQAYYDRNLPTVLPADTTAAPPPAARRTMRRRVGWLRSLPYFRAPRNERRTLILGFNPLAAFYQQLPVSVEYYLPYRLGYEVVFTGYRQPFLQPFSRVPTGRRFAAGGWVGLRQKFYHRYGGAGAWYFAHELRYGNIHYQAYVRTSPNPTEIEKRLSARQQRYAYSWLVGTRVLEELRRYGHFTFDVYAGLGVSYRHLGRTSGAEELARFSIFDDLRDSEVRFPFRGGFTLGYYFRR